MNKLLAFKSWLTVAEAANHLSKVFADEVTEADVLRFALDRHLTLSVYFVNRTSAICTDLIGVDQISKGIEISPEQQRALGFKAVDGKPFFLTRALYVGDGMYADFPENVTTIDGVWDLLMIGGEALDVEHKLQALTDGPAVTLTAMEGSFLRQGDRACQLQESLDDNPFIAGSKAHGDELERLIQVGKVPYDDVGRLRDKYKKERNKYLKDRKSRPSHHDYHSAGGLPDDAVLVVRPDALLEFQQLVAEIPTASVREIEILKTEIERLEAENKGLRKTDDPRQIRNMAKAIYGIAVEKYRYDPSLQRNAATGAMSKAAEKKGVKITQGTIKRYIDQGKQYLDEDGI